MPWLVAIWLLGVFCLSARTVGGWWMIQRIRRASMVRVPARARRQLCAAVSAHRHMGSVDLRICERISSPLAMGIVRSLVLLPASALTSLSPEQLEVVLAHELAHIRRADYLWNMLQTMIETLFFFHPAVWWIEQEPPPAARALLRRCSARMLCGPADLCYGAAAPGRRTQLASSSGDGAGRTPARRPAGADRPHAGRDSAWPAGRSLLGRCCACTQCWGCFCCRRTSFSRAFMPPKLAAPICIPELSRRGRHWHRQSLCRMAERLRETRRRTICNRTICHRRTSRRSRRGHHGLQDMPRPLL